MSVLKQELAAARELFDKLLTVEYHQTALEQLRESGTETKMGDDGAANSTQSALSSVPASTAPSSLSLESSQRGSVSNRGSQPESLLSPSLSSVAAPLSSTSVVPALSPGPLLPSSSAASIAGAIQVLIADMNTALQRLESNHIELVSRWRLQLQALSGEAGAAGPRPGICARPVSVMACVLTSVCVHVFS